MKTNFVLIDYENVQPKDMNLLVGRDFRVRIFVGATQKSIAIETAAAVQPLGEHAEYIRISGSGSNALDFHIACYVGMLSVEHPDAYFHIISKDKGFDPLIQHLKDRKLHCERWQTLQEIPPVKRANSKTTAERVASMVERLNRHKASRPKAMKTLSSMIRIHFLDTLSDAQVAEVIEMLKASGAISETSGKISYGLPD